MSDPLDLPAIRKALAEATPGPWVRWQDHAEVYAGPAKRNTPLGISGTWGRVAQCDGGEDFDPEEEYANAHLIVFLRNSAERLLGVAEAARDLRRAMRTGGGCDIETTERLAKRVDEAGAALDAKLGGGA